MKALTTYRVNTIFAVSILALFTYVAADTIIQVSTDAEIEFQYMALETRVAALEAKADLSGTTTAESVPE